MKLAAGLALALAGAALSGEALSGHGQAGFKLGYEAANAEQSIREFVPEGESVQDWSRMITDQRLVGLVRLATPKRFAEAMITGLEGGCPGGKAGAIQKLKVSGRPAARVRADCPRNPATGKPETFFMLVIAGEKDMHSRQVAFRRVPDAADVKWAETVLAKTVLCGAGKQAKGC